jgi:2-desacetyl-2-hydroxyethyl bacteriochlorophyllide A dehydrogenase
MKSYHVTPGKGLAGLSLREGDEPRPGRGQVLVRIRANSVGARDLRILSGGYPLPVTPGVIPGCEGAGDVVAVGADVGRVKVGDRVAATVFPRWLDGPFKLDVAPQLGSGLDGVLTEYAVLGEDGVVPIPAHLSYEEAATLPLAAVTAWNAVSGGRPLHSGETVLTLGSGGVSLFAMRFAKLAGARVIITTSTEGKAERLRALGADEVINYREHPEWWKVVRALTDDQGVDHVLDATGPLDQSLRSLAFDGELSFIGYWLSGAPGSSPIDPGTLFMAGNSLRRIATGSRAHFLALNRAISAHQVRPVIDRVFPFEDVPAAFRHCESGEGFGKVVISHAA